MTVADLLKTPPTHIQTVKHISGKRGQESIGFTTSGAWYHSSMSILPRMENRKTFWYLGGDGKLFYIFEELPKKETV